MNADRHWSENREWTDALDSYCLHRDSGNRFLTIDITEIEKVFFQGGGPAYQLYETLVNISNDEGEKWDGLKGVPRVCLAFLMKLHELSNRQPSRDRGVGQ